MAIQETTFDDLSEDLRSVAYAVYNKLATRSIDFKSKVLKETDNVLMVNEDATEAGYRSMNSLKEAVEDFVVKDYLSTKQFLETLSSRAYSMVIGDGRKTYTLEHGLDADAIICQLWSNYAFDIPFHSISKVDRNTISITFEESVPTDAIEVVIQANKYTTRDVTVTNVDWDNISNIPVMEYDEMVQILQGVQ